MALVIAVLYFLLMELLLIDSSRALGEAQRFRSRAIAMALAENGAELAAERMIFRHSGEEQAEDNQGKCAGEFTRSGDPLSEGGAHFELRGSGKSKGLAPTEASLFLEGTIKGGRVSIDWARYSQ